MNEVFIMAKTKVCPFCGKELSGKLFATDSLDLELGKTFSSERDHIVCCEECHSKYEASAKSEGERFAVKMANIQKSTHKKLGNDQKAKLFLKYLEEKDQRTPYTGEPGLPISFCSITPDGHFSVMEFNIDERDFSTRDYQKTLDRIYKYDNKHVFSAGDVSMLQYRVSNRFISTVFTSFYTYDIRLNDEKAITYKPCIARFIVKGTGLFPTHSANKKMLAFLKVFQEKVGVNIPITKVKKFR